MKKILCLLLTILLIFTTIAFVGCDTNNTAEDKTANCVHEYVLYSSTATCTKSGTETYKCLYCEKTTTKEITNPSHTYEKNKCSTCGDTITDIKNLSTAQKNYLCEKLEDTFPYLYDSEALSASQSLYLSCKNDVEDCEVALTNAKNARPIRVFNAETGQWEQVVDQKKIQQAEKNLANAQELFDLAKLSYEITCEGYACTLTIQHIKGGSNPSNYTVKEKLVYLMAVYIMVTDNETSYVPDWYTNITTAIKTIIGIDITK